MPPKMKQSRIESNTSSRLRLNVLGVAMFGRMQTSSDKIPAIRV